MQYNSNYYRRQIKNKIFRGRVRTFSDQNRLNWPEISSLWSLDVVCQSPKKRYARRLTSLYRRGSLLPLFMSSIRLKTIFRLDLAKNIFQMAVTSIRFMLNQQRHIRLININLRVTQKIFACTP